MPDEIDVKTEVSNKVVNETLENGESVTVPDNEVWVVSLLIANDVDGWADYMTFTVNGVQYSWRGEDDTGDRGPLQMEEIVLVGGDEFTVGTGPDGSRAGACHMTGFVVNEEYEA